MLRQAWWWSVPGYVAATLAVGMMAQRRCMQGYKSYSQAHIDKALDMVHEGAALADAENASGVPYSSIRRFLAKCRAHPGPCKGAKYREGFFAVSYQDQNPANDPELL
ncbi:hypothetical protein ACOMHN_007471 [Nucella lapillus]